MHVVATAGHVDHGKSTLVRALTGMEPDRWAEERRRGMTIDLGFAWTTLPGGETVAFVDVPGHERFVPTMLAGVGPAPAVVLVVAADEGWRQQSAEHLAAIDALGVAHGLLVVTRCDLVDPSAVEAAETEARQRLATTGLRHVESVAVSAATGEGLDECRAALSRLVASLPAADIDGDVRLWVDRSFSITGAGTIVTGTLTRGTMAVGDVLELASSAREVRVRGLQSLGEAREGATAVARVAVNLRGVDQQDVRRGDALLAPDVWLRTDEIDVRVGQETTQPWRAGTHLMLHVGSAAVPVRVRPLAEDVVRLRLATPLPLHIGDRALLREPSNHDVTLGVTVLDPWPPRLRRRGDAVRRAQELRSADGSIDGDAELRRRGVVPLSQLRRLGVRALPTPLFGDWLVAPDRRDTLRGRLRDKVAEHRRTHPLEPGITTGALAAAVELPDPALVLALLPAELVVTAGRVTPRDAGPRLPPAVRDGVDTVRRDLEEAPFAAPDADRLRALGLGRRELAAAAHAGELLVLADAIVLLPDAPRRARESLTRLPAPFTVSQARQAWQTTRRVALPLLDLLDRTGVTIRLPDGTRHLA